MGSVCLSMRCQGKGLIAAHVCVLFSRYRTARQAPSRMRERDAGEYVRSASEGRSSAAETGSAHEARKQSNVVGLVAQGWLGNFPRICRPRIIVLQIRLGRRLRLGRHQAALTDREIPGAIAAIGWRTGRRPAARVGVELWIWSTHQKAWSRTRRSCAHPLPSRPMVLLS